MLYAGTQIVWRHRRVFGHVANLHGNESFLFVFMSPDGDVQIEDFSGESGDIAAVRFSAARRDVPPGVLGNLLYKFGDDISASKVSRSEKVRLDDGGRKSYPCRLVPAICDRWEKHAQPERHRAGVIRPR